MMVFKSHLNLALILSWMIIVRVEGRISTTDCTTSNPCLAANSVCDTDNSKNKCKCIDNYVEDTKDGSTCVRKVSSIVCASESAICTAIENTVCDTNCGCKPGYNETADKCIIVHGSSCSLATDCPSNSNSSCLSGTCQCKADFAEKNKLCKLKVSATQCKDTCTIANAMCEENLCICNDGYSENADTCQQSKALSLGMSISGLMLCLVVGRLQAYREW